MINMNSVEGQPALVEVGKLYGMSLYIELPAASHEVRDQRYHLVLATFHKLLGRTEKNNSEELEWARPFLFEQCTAVKERNRYHGGRCELRKGHKGDHALEMGMDAPRWSTEWTG